LLGFGFGADWMAFFTFAGADCVTTGFADLVAFFRAAHLAFCAAAIRAFPASLIVRLEVFAAAGALAFVALLMEPFGRPRCLLVCLSSASTASNARPQQL
jgi:hypothetical protein